MGLPSIFATLRRTGRFDPVQILRPFLIQINSIPVSGPQRALVGHPSTDLAILAPATYMVRRTSVDFVARVLQKSLSLPESDPAADIALAASRSDEISLIP
jgi:hypothetical protein